MKRKSQNYEKKSTYGKKKMFSFIKIAHSLFNYTVIARLINCNALKNLKEFEFMETNGEKKSFTKLSFYATM